jgi:hypothetical protein
MGIDPNAPQHPIVGGYPGEYGAVYEAYRQPWFREAIDSNRFRQSVREASSEMLNVYQSTFFDPLPYEVVASGFYSLTDQGFEFVESPTIPF